MKAMKVLTSPISMMGVALCLLGPVGAAPNPAYDSLMQDILINADYWTVKPQILGAGLGFTQILGVPNLSTSAQGQAANAAFGGAWEVLSTTNPNSALRAYTSLLRTELSETTPAL